MDIKKIKFSTNYDKNISMEDIELDPVSYADNKQPCIAKYANYLLTGEGNDLDIMKVVGEFAIQFARLPEEMEFIIKHPADYSDTELCQRGCSFVAGAYYIDNKKTCTLPLNDKDENGMPAWKIAPVPREKVYNCFVGYWNDKEPACFKPNFDINKLLDKYRYCGPWLPANWYTSKHLHQIKDKVELELLVYETHDFNGAYGTGTVVKMRDKDHNEYVWFSSTTVRCPENGIWAKVKGTVKDNAEYHGSKNTTLTRCKIEPIFPYEDVLKNVIRA